MNAKDVQSRLKKLDIDLSLEDCTEILEVAKDLEVFVPCIPIDTIIDVAGILTTETGKDWYEAQMEKIRKTIHGEKTVNQ